MVQDNKQYLKIFFFNFNALSGPLDPNMINHNFIYIILSLYFSNEKKTLCSVSQSKATHTFHYQTIQYHGNISNFGQASDLSPPTFHDSGHIESKQECQNPSHISVIFLPFYYSLTKSFFVKIFTKWN